MFLLSLINHAKHLPFNWVARAFCVFVVPTIMILLYTSAISKDLSETLYFSEAETGKIENRVNVTALWSHHEPLSSAAALRLSTLATNNNLQLRILCASAPCITMAASLGIPAERFVLPNLCKESPLQPFALHHVFYKAVLEKEFPSVLQLVAGLCLAYSEQMVFINPNVDFDFPSILNSEVLEVSSKARSEVSPNTSSLRFTRRRELVFAQTSEPRSPLVKDLMEKVMASLDPLPTPVKDNLPIVGKSKLMKLPEFAERVLDVEEDELLKEGEEPGCIHYDSFQTDCRKGKEEKYCAINAGNEMQVCFYRCSKYGLQYTSFRAWQACSICPWYPPGSTTPTSRPTRQRLLTPQPSPLATPGGENLFF